MNGMTQAERDAMYGIRDLAMKALSEIGAHEEVCEVRQGNIQGELKTIRYVLISIAMSSLGGLSLILVNMITHFPPHP